MKMVMECLQEPSWYWGRVEEHWKPKCWCLNRNQRIVWLDAFEWMDECIDMYIDIFKIFLLYEYVYCIWTHRYCVISIFILGFMTCLHLYPPSQISPKKHSHQTELPQLLDLKLLYAFSKKQVFRAFPIYLTRFGNNNRMDGSYGCYCAFIHSSSVCPCIFSKQWDGYTSFWARTMLFSPLDLMEITNLRYVSFARKRVLLLSIDLWGL